MTDLSARFIGAPVEVIHDRPPALEKRPGPPDGFLYALLIRHLPDVPERAREISRAEARRAVVLRYLETVVFAEPAMIARVFHVLRWTPTELERTIHRLLQEGAARRVEAPGWPCPQLVHASALERAHSAGDYNSSD